MRKLRRKNFFLDDVELLLNDLDEEASASIENGVVAKEETQNSFDKDKQNNSKEISITCLEIEQEINVLKEGLKKYDKIIR